MARQFRLTISTLALRVLIYGNQGVLLCQELPGKAQFLPTELDLLRKSRRSSIIPYTELSLTRDEALAVITLQKPAANNRIDEAMAGELRELCAEISGDNGLRVVVLTGAGAVFSTGRNTPATRAQLARMQAAGAVASLAVPVLVAINGDATDHGLELALAGDIRVAAPAAKFGFTVPATGNFPFDGATQRLPRLVGPGWARDMLLTGRRIDSAEALSIGLVNRVSAPSEDPLQLARKLAEEIMESSPLGARYIKEAATLGADLTLSQALGLEADLNIILQSTTDRAEGIASFLERRHPKFTGG